MKKLVLSIVKNFMKEIKPHDVHGVSNVNKELRKELLTLLALGVFALAVLIVLYVYELKTGGITTFSANFYNWLLQR